MKLLILFLISCAVIVVSFSSVTGAGTERRPPISTNWPSDYYNWRNQNYPVASSDAGLAHLGQQAD